MQPFVLYNSEQRKKVEFVPRKEGQIDIYVCGMTVYDYCHIGHARVMVAFDYIIRFLRSQGWNVKYVRNITDIDDKIIKRANENGESIQALTDRFIQAMNEDAASLGCVEPDVAPRATEYIDQMQNMIGNLVNKGTAYPARNGDVYFQVEKFDKYGRLSGRKLEDMQAGASERVDKKKKKKHPFDFVLWKHAKENEPSWASPWGNGRPGWHIECSAMSTCCLGNHFDIHGGGSDLMFPHHENEIAQSEAANGKPFAHYWMHNAFLNIDNHKMSKSAGNFFTVRDIVAKYGPMVLRFFMLSAHYRSPLNFSAELMEAAANSLERIRTAVATLQFKAQNAEDSELTEQEKELLAQAAGFEAKFDQAMDDDFNTADAIAAIFELVKFANTCGDTEHTKAFWEALKEKITTLSDVCGLIVEKKEELLDADVEALIEERQAARKAKNFARADEIRQQLLDMGIVLEDTREGVKWKRA